MVGHVDVYDPLLNLLFAKPGESLRNGLGFQDPHTIGTGYVANRGIQIGKRSRFHFPQWIIGMARSGIPGCRDREES